MANALGPIKKITRLSASQAAAWPALLAGFSFALCSLWNIRQEGNRPQWGMTKPPRSTTEGKPAAAFVPGAVSSDAELHKKMEAFLDHSGPEPDALEMARWNVLVAEKIKKYRI